MELINKFFEEENIIEKIIRDHWIMIDPYNINDDGSIDVFGNVKFSADYLTELPLRFKVVTGNFDCSKLSLLTLENSPIEVGGTFNCSYNQLSTLEHLPKNAACFVFDNTVKSLYTGGVNCNFEKVILLTITDISAHLNPKFKLEDSQLRLFFKYQNYFGIYDDKIINNEALEELIQEMNEGLK